MPTFTHKPVDPDDEALLAEIFQLGKDSQLPAELGCTAIPYPTLTRIRDIANDPNFHMFVVYADGNNLRVAIAHDDEGYIRFCVSKPWQDPQTVIRGGPVHPNGAAQSAYLHGLVKQNTGIVRTFNNTTHPAIVKLHQDAGVTVVEVDSAGLPTGKERKA